jgi:hypothetical protein
VRDIYGEIPLGVKKSQNSINNNKILLTIQGQIDCVQINNRDILETGAPGSTPQPIPPAIQPHYNKLLS